MTKQNKVSFEDALEKTGFGTFNYLMLLLCGLLMTSMVFESVSVSYIVPASACELHTTSSQQGLMAGMPLIGIIATSHFWGFYADTKGRRKILILSLILGFVAGALATLSPHWIVLCVLKLASCSAVSGTLALAFTLISESTPRAHRNFVLVLISSIYFLAVAVMAVLAIPVLGLKFSHYIPIMGIYFKSWRLLNFVYSLPCFLGVLGLLMAYESPKYLITAGKESEALEVLKGIFVINTGKNREDFPVDQLYLEENSLETSLGLWESIKSQTLPLIRPPLLKNTLLISLILGLIYLSTYPFILWMPSISDSFMRSLERGDSGLTFCQMMRSTQNLTLDQTRAQDCSLNQNAIIVVFAIQLVMAAATTLMSAFMSCFSRKGLLIGIQLVTGVAGVCLNITTSWMISAALFLVFMCGVANFSLLNTYSVDLFPTYVKAMAICINVMAGRTTSVFGINLLKYLLVNDCEAAFYIFPGLAIACGLSGFLLPSDAAILKNKPKTEDLK